MSKTVSKPTKRMRSAAWRALHAIAIDGDAGSTARVSAARALVKDDPEQAEAEEMAAKASRGRPALICLPDNSRDPQSTRLGITRAGDDGCYMIIYDGNSEQGLADYARWQAEVKSAIEAEYPTKPQLLLAAPVKPKPMTGAERLRKHRAKIKAAKALEAAA